MVDEKSRHRLLVVGGGFGGLWAVRTLKRTAVDITLVDKRNFHLFQPLLYQVATGGLSPADIASPLRGILANQRNVTVKLDEMAGIDFDRQCIHVRDGLIEYDSLIVATGSENHYYGKDHWSAVAPGLKTIEDALHIRNRVYAAFEAAEKETDPEERRRLMTFVIIGGGPTGVELAGALAEIARITLRDNFRSIDPTEAQIIILEGGPAILAGYHKKLRAAATKSLEHLGVEVRTGMLAENIDDRGVTAREIDRTCQIESRTVLWAAGVKPSPVARMLARDPTGLDKTGRVVVDANLNLPGRDDVFVIGDLASVNDDSGAPIPGTAPLAMSQGRYVARRIADRIRGKEGEPYKYRSKGNMAVIGRASAVADLGHTRFSGYPAWLLWLFVHLMYLVEFDNRLLVFLQWAWSYFTRNRGARLITYGVSPSNGKSEAG